jgi:hypothetical protein
MGDTAGIDCSPADNRRAVWGAALALAQLALGELDDALESAESASGEDDRLYLSRFVLAAVHLARKDQVNAAVAVRECVRTKPDLSREEVTCVVGDTLGAGVWAIAQTLLEGPGPRQQPTFQKSPQRESDRGAEDSFRSDP